MTAPAADIVLASRSPRRLELLSLLVERDRIHVQPPASADEPGFDGLHDLESISARLREVAAGKCSAVRAEYRGPWRAILAADTVIVGEQGGLQWDVLGQPPDHPDWAETVRDWFERYYFDRTHLAMTALALCSAEGRSTQRVVVTKVRFSAQRRGWLEWYLSTGESRGKAGGYALQGLASVFIDQVEGSLSNVVGLPVAETREMLLECGF